MICSYNIFCSYLKGLSLGVQILHPYELLLLFFPLLLLLLLLLLQCHKALPGETAGSMNGAAAAIAAVALLRP